MFIELQSSIQSMYHVTLVPKGIDWEVFCWGGGGENKRFDDQKCVKYRGKKQQTDFMIVGLLKDFNVHIVILPREIPCTIPTLTHGAPFWQHFMKQVF